jgi:hypothetical protein
MNESRTAATPIRATIVLSTDAMLALSQPVPKEYRRTDVMNPITTYLDLLPFLGRHGYRILIPEIVSVKTAQVLADGRNTKNFFEAPSYSEMGYARPFLKMVAHDGYPNISIVTNTGPADVDAYCDALRAALGISNVRPRDHTKNFYKGRERSHAIIDLIGDKSIGSGLPSVSTLANTLAHEKKDPPLIVLTDDGHIMEQLSGHARYLRIRYFMHYLVESGIGHAAGLTADASSDAMSRQIYTARKRPIELIEGQFSSKGTYDFVRSARNKPSPLYGTLEELKRDLDAAPTKPEPQPEKPICGPQTAAQRRLAEFAKLGVRSK